MEFSQWGPFKVQPACVPFFIFSPSLKDSWKLTYLIRPPFPLPYSLLFSGSLTFWRQVSFPSPSGPPGDRSLFLPGCSGLALLHRGNQWLAPHSEIRLSPSSLPFPFPPPRKWGWPVPNFRGAGQFAFILASPVVAVKGPLLGICDGPAPLTAEKRVTSPDRHLSGGFD